MANYKGKCVICGNKCSVLSMYCKKCLDYANKYIRWNRCNFVNPSGLRCLREGHYYNGYCPSHQPGADK